VQPAGLRSTVSGISRAGTDVDHAIPGDAIALTLADHVDVGRGDVVVANDGAITPCVTNELVADVCWFVDTPVRAGSRFVAKHLTRQVSATVAEVIHRLDPTTLAAGPADELALNDLGRVRVVLAEPIVADRYVDQREGGRLVLVEEDSNATAGALMIVESVAV